MFKEFKQFALKGNVVDLAIGVVIGAAFGNIVNSLVNDIITPIIAFLTSGVNFKLMVLTVGNVTFAYGNFIQNVINFLIVAFSIFLVVKLINKARKKEEANTASGEASKQSEQELLAEIRDLLKAGIK